MTANDKAGMPEEIYATHEFHGEWGGKYTTYPVAEVLGTRYIRADLAEVNQELLAALKGCVAQLRRDTELLYEQMPYTEPSIIQEARAAIAKATGVSDA